MQAIGGAVKADIGRHDAGRGQFVQRLDIGGLMDIAPRGEFLDERGFVGHVRSDNMISGDAARVPPKCHPGDGENGYANGSKPGVATAVSR